MRIGYDISSITGHLSGVGTYTFQLLTHMLAADAGHEYLLLSNRTDAAATLASHSARDATRPFPKRMAWMQLALPRLLRELRPDICHYPNSIAPLVSPCPYVLTIHDMTLNLLPSFHPWRKQVLVRPLIALVARRAAAIITDSEQSRRDIVRLLRVPAERVAVIPAAAAPLFQPMGPQECERVRRVYGIVGPYLLYVGTLEPRKNLVRLIRAWHALRREGAIAHRLVIVGARGWQYGPIFEEVTALGCADDVIFTGYVPREDLPALYSGADVFAFPSLYEGFGLPVVEAMACGTPVLISTTPALTEVADGAALAVDPTSVGAISEGLVRLASDERLRGDLRERGLQRARNLSWRTTAQRTIELYGRVAQHVPLGSAPLRTERADIKEAL